MEFEKAQNTIINFLSSDNFKKHFQGIGGEVVIKSIPTLIEITKRGFIRHTSQDGEIKGGLDNKTNMYWIMKDRAYIEGFMKKEQGRIFIENIKTYTNKVAYEVYKSSDVNQDGHNTTIDVTLYREGPHYPLSGPFEICNSLFINEPRLDYYYYLHSHDKETKKIEQNDVIKVVCFDPQYGRQAGGPDGLYQSILENL